MTADKDALLREALEWLPKEGFDDNLSELRSLRARITAALEQKMYGMSLVVDPNLPAGVTQFKDASGKVLATIYNTSDQLPPLPKGDE